MATLFEECAPWQPGAPDDLQHPVVSTLPRYQEQSRPVALWPVRVLECVMYRMTVARRLLRHSTPSPGDSSPSGAPQPATIAVLVRRDTARLHSNPDWPSAILPAVAVWSEAQARRDLECAALLRSFRASRQSFLPKMPRRRPPIGARAFLRPRTRCRLSFPASRAARNADNRPVPRAERHEVLFRAPCTVLPRLAPTRLFPKHTGPCCAAPPRVA